MKSIRSLKNYPAGLPVLADDILELHSARILLLIKLCGKRGRISGLTKMAKLDFFVRYPKFFLEAVHASGKTTKLSTNLVESKMIRYHYGPWDQRYYQVLAYLESRGLVEIGQSAKTFELKLTRTGDDAAIKLALEPSFEDLCNQMRRVGEAMGDMKGSELKSLVYKLFDEEVAQLKLNEVIE